MSDKSPANLMADFRMSGITRAEVRSGQTAVIGSRVKHSQDRPNGRATASVVGFSTDSTRHDTDHPGRPWTKVHVEPDYPENDPLNGVWDWDRTILIADA